VIVDLKSKNAELQEQLDTMLLSAFDDDLQDLDINRALRLIPLFKLNLFKLNLFKLNFIKFIYLQICTDGVLPDQLSVNTDNSRP